MSNGNYVALSRETPPDTVWYTHKNKTLGFLMFILIIDAKYRNGAWNGVVVNRGDVVLGKDHYAKKLGMTKSTLEHSLKRLQEMGEIKVETKRGFDGYTKVSILKYDDYVAKIVKIGKTEQQNNDEDDEGEGDEPEWAKNAVQY